LLAVCLTYVLLQPQHSFVFFLNESILCSDLCPTEEVQLLKKILVLNTFSLVVSCCKRCVCVCLCVCVCVCVCLCVLWVFIGVLCLECEVVCVCVFACTV